MLYNKDVRRDTNIFPDVSFYVANNLKLLKHYF